MPKAPVVPPNEGARAGGPPRRDPPPDEAIRDHVLAVLGRPPELLRVAVTSLWDNHYRVNVLTGPDATAVRIAHSFFIQATAGGEVVAATPPIARRYP